jgi:hypothetical protein
MRVTEPRRGRLVLLSLLLAGCGLLVGITPATASGVPTADDYSDKGCIQLHIFENTKQFYLGNTLTGVGAAGNYLDRLYSSGDFSTQIGNGVGTYDLVYQRTSDGHMIEYSTEHDQFAEGSFVISDYFDRTAMFAMEWVGGENGQGMKVRGVSGKYLGMTGTVKWRVLSFTQPGIPTELIYVLCRPPGDHD